MAMGHDDNSEQPTLWAAALSPRAARLEEAEQVAEVGPGLDAVEHGA